MVLADRSPARYIYELNWRKCRAARLLRGWSRYVSMASAVKQQLPRRRATLFPVALARLKPRELSEQPRLAMLPILGSYRYLARYVPTALAQREPTQPDYARRPDLIALGGRAARFQIGVTGE